MVTFKFRSRENHGRPAERPVISEFESQLMGIEPEVVEPGEPGAKNWHKSSFELLDGLEVTQEVEMDTLPDDLMELFKKP